MNGFLVCVFVCLEFEVFVCELVVGCVRVLFAYFVIAVWVCICLVLSLGATKPGKCAYHEFWIPGSPGAMILDRNCFLKN